jgi:hypothetical protein
MLSPKTTHRFAVYKMFGQSQGVGNAALSFLTGILEPLQAEALPVAQQFQKISWIPALANT